jgi:hypothetical protein
VAVEEYGTANGPADYALCDGGTVRAVVEAKKVTLGPQGVLIQAERYSKGIGQLPLYQDEFGVPVPPCRRPEVPPHHPRSPGSKTSSPLKYSGGPMFHEGTLVALNTWTFSYRCDGPNLQVPRRLRAGPGLPRRQPVAP